MTKPTCTVLFAGGGGAESGLTAAGIDCPQRVEFDADICAVNKVNRLYQPNKLGGFFAAPSFSHSMQDTREGFIEASPADLDAALPSDIVLHNTTARVACAAYKVAARPKARHIPQVRKLLTQNAARVPFDHLDNLRAADVRRDANKQMHMVGHNLNCADCAAQIFNALMQQFGQSGSDGTNQDAAAILGAKDDMVANCVNSVSLMRVLHLEYPAVYFGFGQHPRRFAFQGNSIGAREFLQEKQRVIVNVNVDLVQAVGRVFGRATSALLFSAKFFLGWVGVHLGGVFLCVGFNLRPFSSSVGRVGAGRVASLSTECRYKAFLFVRFANVVANKNSISRNSGFHIVNGGDGFTVNAQVVKHVRCLLCCVRYLRLTLRLYPRFNLFSSLYKRFFHRFFLDVWGGGIAGPALLPPTKGGGFRAGGLL